MSAPDTHIQTQQERHIGPLSGMALSIAVATVAFLGLLAWFALTGTDETVANDAAIGGAIEDTPLD